jgi:hypothetical protein
MPYITNWPLAWRVAEFIIDHPDQHDQEYWYSDCGTAACFAGWTTFLSGWRPLIILDQYQVERDIVTDDGAVNGHERGRVQDIAIKELGMEPIGDTFWQLFDSDNTLKDIINTLVRWAYADKAEIPARITEKHIELNFARERI